MSSQSWWILIIAAISVWFLSHQAGRLDRLHHRIEVTESALDSHLAKRSALCMELCSTDGLDLVTSALLVQAAHEALSSGDIDLAARHETESVLSEVLAEIFDGPELIEQLSENVILAELLAQLEQVCGRIVLSQKFHNDAVRDCLMLRQQMLVKVLRLAGRAPLPHPFDVQLDSPPGFAK